MRTFVGFLVAAIMCCPMPSVAAMIDAHPEYDDLIARCAPGVHPDTMKSLIGVESQWHQYALADAGIRSQPWKVRRRTVRSFIFANEDEAIRKAKELLRDGHTVSLGLTQINDRNLGALGLTLETVFDACRNLEGGGKILVFYYSRAQRHFGATPAALEAALSAYNSGNWESGKRDGYVDMVYRQAISRPYLLRRTDRPRRVQGGMSVDHMK